MPKITKAVIAAAGYGTRFLPQTKAMPKEMLPLVDKPIIQYIVEELVGAGIQDIIIVTGYHKRSIEDHFDHTSGDLKINLINSGKLKLLEQVKAISDVANFIYIRQKGPYGNATPLVNVEHLVGNEPFIYTFADDILVAKPSRFKQLIAAYEKNPGVVLTAVKVKYPDSYSKYGFVSGKEVEPGLIKTETIIEKPGTRAKSPSDIASVSGYVIDPALYKYIHHERKKLKTGEEFIAQTAMQKMIEDGGDIWSLMIKNGEYYDTGDKLGYVKTIIDFSLQHPELRADIKKFIRRKVL